MRGREPVAPARVDRVGACGRGRSRPAHSGGFGAPPGGHYEPPARSLADDREIPRRKRGPGAEGKRRTARREAPRILAKGCVQQRTVAPLGVLSPSLFREGLLQKL